MSSQQRQDLRGPCNNSRDCQGPTGTNRGCARSIFSMLATAALFTLLRPAAAKCGTQIFSQDFGKYSGAYQTWSEDLAAVDFHVGGAKRPSAAGDLLKPGIDIPSRGFENVNVGEGNMRLDFPKGCIGTKEGCGVVTSVRLPKPLTEATLSYSVRFSPDYGWTLGGKLPGMCGEQCPFGCVESKGSFSERVMWRAGGQLVSYMYLTDRTAHCGEDWRWGKAAGDVWNEIRVYNRVNDVGKANGVQRAWLNGQLVLDRSDVKFRANGDNLIEKFILHNYHGGSDERFAPPADQSIWFDNIWMNEGECAP